MSKLLGLAWAPKPTSYEPESVTRLTARDPRRFHGLHRFSLTINDSNQPGKLLSLKSQLPRIEQMGFGHSSGTVEEQGR